MPSLKKEQKTQLFGSFLMLVIVAIFVVVLPLFASSLPDPNRLKGGQRFDMGNGVSIVPSDGWSLDPDSDPSFFTILLKEGVKLIFVSPREENTTLEEKTEALVLRLESDSMTDWTIDWPFYFETDAGALASMVTAHSPSVTNENWIVAEGNVFLVMASDSSDSSWMALHEEMDQVIRTVQIEVQDGV